MSTLPREVPDRDEFYLGLAFYMAGKSKDPSTQCGAVIVAPNNFPLGWGYNGPPKKMDDQEIDWSRPNKYKYIKHAEVNAIDHSCGDTTGSTIYVTGRPCPGCMLEIVSAEISTVIFYPFKPKDGKSSMLGNDEIWAETQDIARRGHVELLEFSGDLNWVEERYLFMKGMGMFIKGESE